ncbi:MAG: PEGA domain-containing protein [Bacteroidaceae bacterium]|nr:PEGA domain-containing protein [Bacteroidaceae bacterium]
MRKIICIFFAALLGTLSLSAQQLLKFSVASFQLDPFDQTALNPEFEKIDGSGYRYAIIKVTSDNPDDKLSAFLFNFFSLRHEVREHNGELWVYVQKNAKRVTITRPGYMAVNRYDLGTAIQEGKVYTMQLSVQTPEVKHRILQFKVTPPDVAALVKVKREDSDGDYELWGTVDASGGIARRLETGIYEYEVTAEHFDPTPGRVVLTYAEDNLVEEVPLLPNFGYLEVADENGIAGAQIYVNDKLIGTVPYTKKDRWDVREDYRIMISKGELYKTFNGTFSIKKGETTRLTPKLESNFAETTITVADNAEIFIEGESRGRGKWVGPLKAGTYNVECRLDDQHRPTRRQITVKPNLSETFQLDVPTPIVGSIFVNSKPLGATIQLDGKEVGNTPKEVREVLIGTHTVRVIHDGYRVEQQTVKVEEGKTAELDIQLRDQARFTINAHPQARLTLDGKDVGLTPYSFDGASGDYDIRLDCHRYKTFHQKTALRASAPQQTFRLQRIFQMPTSFYLGAGFQAGTLMGLNAHAGAYIYNINIEAYATFGMGSETGYLNYIDGTSSQDENLKARLFGGKVGYGITVGSRLRITPQVGLGALSVTSDHITASALCATLGCRIDYALTSFFGVNLTPEGQFALSKKDVFKQISEQSSKVKGWGTGAGARIGVYLYF